ncbi:MAG: flagellar basal-body MS-ring/collar protein FliF [Bryobacteraceae bacterium]
MEQFRRILAQLTRRQQIMIGVAAIVVVAALVFFVRRQNDRGYVTLYSGLSAEDASAVVTRLKEGTVAYKVSEDGTTIRVKSDTVPELRLQMAAAGIPKTGRIGFELFDRNNFGITEFTEQVNYHRAIEGELERTVMTIAEVEHARVHITPAKDSVFLDQRRPAKGSVLLKLKQAVGEPPRKLSKRNIDAITHLVASGVDGLVPEEVSVLDVNGNLLTGQPPEQEQEPKINQALFTYRREVEQDLLAKVNATLEPLMGPKRFRAAVSVDCDLSSSEQSEESYDPARSVMTTSQRSEDNGGTVTPSGVPGAPSNLPRPTSRPGLNGQNFTRRTENIAYQSSRLVRRTSLPQGNVRRVSVSVLLDHVVRWEGTGKDRKRIVEPPPPERLKATRDVVAGVVGFQAERGDVVVVESIPFETTLAWEPPPPPADPSKPAAPGTGKPDAGERPSPVAWVVEGAKKRDPMVLGALGGTLLLILLAVAAAIWVRKKRKKKLALKASGNVDVTEEAAVEGAAAKPSLPEGPSLVDKLGKQFADQMAEKHKKEEEQDKEILSALALSKKLPSATTRKAEVLSKHMGEQSKKAPEAMAQIIRTWMGDGD